MKHVTNTGQIVREVAPQPQQAAPAVDVLRIALGALECTAADQETYFKDSRGDNIGPAIDAVTKVLTTPPQQAAPVAVPAGNWEGAEEWMPLAWELCANECGEEACTELVWEGGPIPEPWGDRWLKYEDQAKEMIALVRKLVPSLAASPQAAPAPPQGAPASQPVALTNADVVEAWRTTEAARSDYGWTSCEWFQAGVRFAQRFYGITQPSQQERT